MSWCSLHVLVLSRAFHLSSLLWWFCNDACFFLILVQCLIFNNINFCLHSVHLHNVKIHVPVWSYALFCSLVTFLNTHCSTKKAARYSRICCFPSFPNQRCQPWEITIPNVLGRCNPCFHSWAICFIFFVLEFLIFCNCSQAWLKLFN